MKKKSKTRGKEQKVTKVKIPALKRTADVEKIVETAEQAVDVKKRIAYDRVRACVDAMKVLSGDEKKPFTKQALIFQAEKLYQEHGGLSNLKEVSDSVNRGIKYLEAAGVIQTQADGGWMFRK